MKYIKKAIVVEAILFNGENFKECEVFLNGNFDSTLNYPNVNTLEGNVMVRDGDYLIKGIMGEFYPCKPDIFELTYEVIK